MIRAALAASTALATPAFEQRGYRVSYRPGVACLGCGHRAFTVGRHSTECGRCATALPLAPGGEGRSDA